eukprot:scaffold1554_cov401-Prasinococcus_capsulatus_cf.AAC.21
MWARALPREGTGVSVHAGRGPGGRAEHGWAWRRGQMESSAAAPVKSRCESRRPPSPSCASPCPGAAATAAARSGLLQVGMQQIRWRGDGRDGLMMRDEQQLCWGRVRSSRAVDCTRSQRWRPHQRLRGHRGSGAGMLAPMDGERARPPAAAPERAYKGVAIRRRIASDCEHAAG